MKAKKIPQGYRYLKLGEQIRKDDLFWNNSNWKWTKIVHDADTSTWVENHVIRKEVKK